MFRRLLSLTCASALVCLAVPAIASAETVSPTSIDFGTHTNMATQFVTLTNDSQDMHWVSGTTVSGPFEASDGCSGYTLYPGMSCMITITFDPEKLGGGALPGRTYEASVSVGEFTLSGSFPGPTIGVLGTVGYPTAIAYSPQLQWPTLRPYVHDGYRDTDRFTYIAAWQAQVGDPFHIMPFPTTAVGVYNANDKLIRYWFPPITATSIFGGTAAVSWNGKNQAGKLVVPGTYWIGGWAHGANGQYQSTGLYVSVRKG